ncbi:MAG: hypothetical protein Q8R36_02715 [bacterium]|nr:hypothetical protein [bacterium]
MQYLPSKKFIILILFVSLVGGGIFAVSYVLRIKTTFNQDDNTNSPVNLFAIDQGERPVSTLPSTTFTSENSQGAAEKMYDEMFTLVAQENAPEIQKGGASTQNIKQVPTTQESLKNYGNKFMTILKKYPYVTAEATIKEFKNLSDNPQNTKSIEALQTIETGYRALGKEIGELLVPEKTYPLHTEITKNIEAIGKSIGYARTATLDSAQMTLVLNVYIALIEATTDRVRDIYNTFIESGVHFNENEPGYAWYNFELTDKNTSQQ